jgi:hypothetical protein
MVASDSFAEFIREQIAALGRITMRRMFGNTGVPWNFMEAGRTRMYHAAQNQAIVVALRKIRTRNR